MKYTNWPGASSMMSSERAWVDFSLEFSKYIWFLLSNCRYKSMGMASNCGTNFTVITSQPQKRFHLSSSLGELSYFNNLQFNSGEIICLLRSLWPKYISSGNQIHKSALIGRLGFWLHFLLVTNHNSAHTGNISSVGFSKSPIQVDCSYIYGKR